LNPLAERTCFSQVLEQLGVAVSPAQLEKMVAEYGVDGSGLVQVGDFARTLDPNLKSEP
jgi:hypothetical protein